MTGGPDPLLAPGLRLVTLNTWKCDGHYALRLQAMAHQLAALDADVVALQEVFAAPDAQAHTGRHLAQALGMTLVDAPARAKFRWMGGQWLNSHSGLAVLTRGPVLDAGVWALPHTEADGERIAQWVDLRVHGQPVRVVNTHLTHLDGAHTLRQQQWQAVLDAAAATPADTLVVVCGDLNATLDDAALRQPLDAGGWQAVSALDGPTPKVTHQGPQGQGQDLDHVVARPSPRMIWTHAAVVLDRIDARVGVTPSDHAGVRVEGRWQGCHKNFPDASNSCHTGL